MKPLKVLVLPLGNYTLASSRTRVYEIFPRIKAKTIKSSICFGWNLGHYGRELEFILKAGFYDALFIQKSISKKILLLTQILKKLGKKIIYDLDDPSYMQWEAVDEFIKLSNLALVENEFNKRHCKQVNSNARVEILLGPIDFQHYSWCARHKKKGGQVVIGWIGSPNTSKNIHLISNALEKIGKTFRSKVKFLIIGGTPERVKYDFKNLEVEYRPWSLDNERKDLAEIDIGIMPVKNDTENKGKGGYKLLQYMAAGIPCIATAVGVNKDLILNKRSGFLISTNNNERGWVNALAYFIKNQKFRKSAGKLGQKMVKKYDISKYCKKLEKVLLELS